MSLKALFVVLALGAVAWPRAGHAEKGKTNQSTKIHSRAGEQSPVVLKVQAGQTMTILAKDGRWIKVRVSGRTGWIPRSKVDLPPEDEDVARNTRRRPFVDGRGTKRGFGGEGGPDDRVGADATGDGDEPSKSSKSDEDEDDDKPARSSKPSRDDDDDDDKSSKSDDDAGDDAGSDAARPMARVSKATPAYNEPSAESDESFTAQPRTALYIVEEKGKWTFIENDEGDAGYVLTSKLDIETPAGGGPRRRAIDLRGRLGVALVSQSLTTPGGTQLPPDNYTASSSSVTIALGGAVLYPYKQRYWLGGELAYDFDKGFPGIEYKNSTTSFSYHNLNLRALGGYDLRKKNGMLVFARLGYHYDSYQVADVTDFTKNTAKLPSQIIQAPTLGAGLVIPLLTQKLGLKVSLDTILVGSSVEQTKNLEDGTDPSAKAVFLGGVLSYRWKPRMDLQVMYDLAYLSISFGGPPPATSQRGRTGTGNSSGSDFNNTLTFGVSYAL